MTSKATAITSDDSDSAFHPDFRSTSSDFIIISSDGVHFRVHRFLLQESSPFFSDMLTLPQPNPAPDACLSLPSVSLSEDSEVVAALLRLTYPDSTPSFTDIDAISKVLFAAQKYEMGSAETSLRRILFEKFLETDPMTLYAMAQRLGWKYEAHLASYNSLKFNLFDPANLSHLSTPGFSSAVVAQLFNLHHNRIEKMRIDLNKKNKDFRRCTNCNLLVPEGPWFRLQMLILDEMERRPLGDGIFRVDFINKYDMKMLWGTKCRCGLKCYDRVDILTEIMDSLNTLPACACQPCDFTSDSTKENVLLRY